MCISFTGVLAAEKEREQEEQETDTPWEIVGTTAVGGG